jgi:hypothetical protein
MMPMLQERVDFLESIRGILNTVDLLSHRQFIEEKITYLRFDIEKAKKADFIDE